MNELNKFAGTEVLEAEGFDALTVTNMGDGVVALSQISEDGNLHNVIISGEMAAGLVAFLQGVRN